MNQMVVYKNELNTVPLRKFSSNEMNILFSIFSEVREKGHDKIEFTFEQLKDLSKYKSKDNKRFLINLKNSYYKLIDLNYIENDEEIIKFVLFTRYEIDENNETIAIQVNPKFKFILNDIVNGFTKFELVEFTNLKSGYSKTAYRLLKQFRKTGFYKVKLDEFRRLLDIPETYRMSDIDKRVLEPIKKELFSCFKYLEITKIKGRGKRKKFIDILIFAFKPEKY